MECQCHHYDPLVKMRPWLGISEGASAGKGTKSNDCSKKWDVFGSNNC